MKARLQIPPQIPLQRAFNAAFAAAGRGVARVE